MEPKVLKDIIQKKKNCLPAREELVNVLINSILCGDINFKEKDSFGNIEERLERIFRMEDFLRANYLIKNNKQDWDNFINGYPLPRRKQTEVSEFMENHKPLALFIWLLNARGVINLEDGEYLFTPVSYEAHVKSNGKIGIKGFLPYLTFNYAGFVKLWRRLGKPKSVLSRSAVLKRFIALENNPSVAAIEKAVKSVNQSIGHVFPKYGFDIHLNDLDVWNVCGFFSKVSTLVALKRSNPANHEIYKKHILEVVGYLFPNFDAACALFYLKKCIPVRAEDIEHQVKDVHENLEGYVNRNRREPQHEESTSDSNRERREPQREVKLHQPSVIRLLQEKVHYTGIEFREGTPTNWMLLPQNTKRRRKHASNFHSMSQWEMNCSNPPAFFRLIKGLENNLVDIINREAATAHDQDESGMAPVNDDNFNDNQAMEIEDAPSQNEVEIDASVAPLNDYHHDVNHLMDHAVAHDNKEYEYSDALFNDEYHDYHTMVMEDAFSQDKIEYEGGDTSVNVDYHDENHPMGDVVSDDEVKNEDCNALVNDYHEINTEGLQVENHYVKSDSPEIDMHADSDQNQDEVMDDMDCFVNDEDDFQGFSTSSEDDSMVHTSSTINVQNLSDIDTPFAIETSTPLASPSIKVSRIVPKPKKHTKKQSSTKKRIKHSMCLKCRKRAPKSMIAKMRCIKASQKSSKKSLKSSESSDRSVSDKEAHETGVLSVKAALLAGIVWWYFRLRN